MSSNTQINSPMIDYLRSLNPNLIGNVEALSTTGSEPGYVQSLLGADEVQKWGGASFGSSGGVVTYTFNSAAYFSDVESNPTLAGLGLTQADVAGFSALLPEQKNAALAAFDLWSDYANITFRETSTPTAAKMVLWEEELLSQGAAGYALPLGNGNTLSVAGVALDINAGEYNAGGYGWFAMVHEIGHAIGLKHPGDYNAGEDDGGSAPPPFLEDFGLEDTWDFSIMSYNEGDIANGDAIPYTPMLYDIAAVQYLYGANTAHNAGNTVYDMNWSVGNYFNPLSPNVSTRWDGGGKDTLNASGYGNSGVILDLREGEAYYSKVGDSYSWNAFGSNIEHARGGQGSDLIKGNTSSNVLIANNGHDKVYAYAGNDTLVGGAGNDSLYGYDGNDDLRGDTGKDKLKGMDGNDRLRGGLENDAYYGGSGADRFIFDQDAGKDVITDFQLGTDMLQYAGGSVTEAYAIAHAEQIGSHVYFDMYGTTVVFMNIDLGDLDGASFIV